MRLRRYFAFQMLFCILLVMTPPLSGLCTARDLSEPTSKIAANQADAHNAPDKDERVSSDHLTNPVVWHDPGNMAAKDLYYGQGGKASAPRGPFVFESEDRSGTNPKFDVRDVKGTKWRVKLGVEARPEVVASRLLWAIGYFVNDDYVLPSAQVHGLNLKRGAGQAKDGQIIDARFAVKPKGQKKIGYWKWADNPLRDTKEFNGLRVMMAVLNNWDLKDINNAVYEDKINNRHILLASDIGATFGTNSLSWTVSRSKGNVGSYEKSGFIQRVTDTEVDFATPKRPNTLLAETAGTGIKQYAMRSGMDWIGDNIPRKDAHWIGTLLGHLRHRQLVDAFRAGDFPPKEIEAYVKVVEHRIQELKAL